MPVTGFRGETCRNGERCRPDLTPRPVWAHGYCWGCWAALPAMDRALAEWEADVTRLDEQVDAAISDVGTAIAILERIWGATP